MTGRGAAVFVSGLWGAGKTTCLRRLEHEVGRAIPVWSIKNHEVHQQRARVRKTGIGVADLRVYYDYVAESFRGVIEGEVSKGGMKIFEVSPPLLWSLMDLTGRAFYLDTPRHKCAERLAKRESWTLKFATRLVEAQWQLTRERGRAFWGRVEAVDDAQLHRALRQIVQCERADFRWPGIGEGRAR